MRIKPEQLVDLFFIAINTENWYVVMEQAPKEINDKEIELLYIAWKKACKRRKTLI